MSRKFSITERVSGMVGEAVDTNIGGALGGEVYSSTATNIMDRVFERVYLKGYLSIKERFRWGKP